jgi:hypothetical protein
MSRNIGVGGGGVGEMALKVTEGPGEGGTKMSYKKCHILFEWPLWQFPTDGINFCDFPNEIQAIPFTCGIEQLIEW